MQNVIAAKDDAALQAGYEKAKYNAMVSGLRFVQTGQPMYQAHHAGDLELVAAYEAEIAARIEARIEAAKVEVLDILAMEAAYYRELDRIEEIEAAKIEAIEMQWAEMVAMGEAEQYEDIEGDGEEY